MTGQQQDQALPVALQSLGDAERAQLLCRRLIDRANRKPEDARREILHLDNGLSDSMARLGHDYVTFQQEHPLPDDPLAHLPGRRTPGSQLLGRVLPFMRQKQPTVDAEAVRGWEVEMERATRRLETQARELELIERSHQRLLAGIAADGRVLAETARMMLETDELPEELRTQLHHALTLKKKDIEQMYLLGEQSMQAGQLMLKNQEYLASRLRLATHIRSVALTQKITIQQAHEDFERLEQQRTSPFGLPSSGPSALRVVQERASRRELPSSQDEAPHDEQAGATSADR